MAKPLVVQHGADSAAFTPIRIDRSKIHGARKRIAVDAVGRICARAALTADGSMLLVSGMTAQGHFTPDGLAVARGEMVGVNAEGNKVELRPSTLGLAQALDGPVDPQEVLSLSLDATYFLKLEEGSDALAGRLKGGEIFKAPFNYTPGYDTLTAYLVGNDEGFFALVGKPAQTSWAEEETAYVPEDGADESDDLDFDAM
jgi:hypothetical protein